MLLDLIGLENNTLMVGKLPSAEFTTHSITVLHNGEYSFISNVQTHYFEDSLRIPLPVKMCLGYKLTDLNYTVLYACEFLQALMIRFASYKLHSYVCSK